MLSELAPIAVPVTAPGGEMAANGKTLDFYAGAGLNVTVKRPEKGVHIVRCTKRIAGVSFTQVISEEPCTIMTKRVNEYAWRVKLVGPSHTDAPVPVDALLNAVLYVY